MANADSLTLPVEYVWWPNRADRVRYVASRYAEVLHGKVLDVGCDQATLKDLLPHVAYTGVDIGGKPDLRLNLDQVEKLPFADRTFDCVVCTEVLEHLDNLHRIFDELVRVAGKHLIISLPNNWTNARVPIERGEGRFGKYGLPVERPPDRHKWFFSLREAADFLHGQTARQPIAIVEMHATEKPRPWLVRALRRLRFRTQERYLNRYAHTVWALLKRI